MPRHTSSVYKQMQNPKKDKASSRRKAKDSLVWTLYRSKISYFSGKLEAYLKYKQIPFHIEEVTRHTLNKIYKHTGIKKMPALQDTDNRWLFDSTPTIAWLENEYGGVPVVPVDPALAFVALLLEDYGDEWLWRPAMWWRWIPLDSRRSLGWRIGSDIIDERIGRLAGWYFTHRQLREWVWGDGVTKSNANFVSSMYFKELEFLEALLEKQPFLLGSHPSIADFGFFASMFRHFGNDPDAAEIMRMQAPHTYEWVARVWNARLQKLGRQPRWVWPKGPHWQPLLDRIANDYLPYLAQNAMAYHADQKRFDYQGKDVVFPETRTTNYRVLCYEILQKRFAELSTADQKKVTLLFAKVGGIADLANHNTSDSGLADRYNIPVHGNDARETVSLRSKLAIWLFGQPRN